MPRRGRISKRDVLPDPIYKSKLVTKLVNNVMQDGKKGVAQTIVYDAFAIVEAKSGKNPLEVAGDILILAGDIVYLGLEAHMRHPFWDWCAENFRQTLVVPGNHELYGGFDAGQLVKEFSLEVRENVRYYNNKVVTIDGIDIILSTLWANISIADAFMVERSINDFRRIVCDEERLTFTKFNQMHEVLASSNRLLLLQQHRRRS